LGKYTWEVAAWEISIWENTLGKLPLGKMTLGAFPFNICSYTLVKSTKSIETMLKLQFKTSS